MKEFLNKAMKRNKKANTSAVKKFQKLFPKITKQIVTTLGEKPFSIRGPLNVSILNSVMCTLINHGEKATANLKENYAKLLKEKEFETLTTLGTTDTTTIKKRFELVQKYLVGK